MADENFTTNKIRRSATAVLCAMAAFALSAIGAYADDVVSMDKRADIAPLCGTKPMKVALIDGFGADTWRKIARAEFEDEIKKCPNVTATKYSDAGGDQQKYNGDINSFVAQGMNIIIALTDFGDAAIPAYRKAFKDGVTMEPYFSHLSGKVGTDYAANTYQDQHYTGGIWADWLGKTLNGKGNVVLLGGTAGAASSKVFMNGFKERLKNYPEMKLLDENYIVTDWNPATAQKAVTGLIAKYPQIDGIASDYGVTTLAAIKAFEQAGLPVPAQATLASNNELNCKYVSAKKDGKAWKYLTLDGTTNTVRFAVRSAVAAFQGIENKEPSAVVPFIYANSETGLDPKCDTNAPPDADLSSGLPEATLHALFNK
ncbi:substrate-binding domain-containing protein [Methylocapsa sp. S129]|jgi:ribose transport system substrate-binding protein|uniref:substrate-binding domain-containing protein n=1 Tax=Methylocapsa sp. S129 TaxID=1641869 RepID=UPI00131BE554|nr:substrate-binding domain-containing protein [Methylocapsa sp. S129]